MIKLENVSKIFDVSGTPWGEYARTLPVCLVFWNGLYYTVEKHICKIYVSHAKYLYLIWQNAGKEEKL